ncbi:hypothetical protein CL617_00525 [archaeon]|nr:hypothetical protein [archaeon]
MATWSTGLSQTDIKNIESFKRRSPSSLRQRLKIIKNKKELLHKQSLRQSRAGNIIDSRATDRKITALTNTEFQINNAMSLQNKNGN